jgi:threonine aldolase
MAANEYARDAGSGKSDARPSSNRLIDLRSDTVSRPSDAMREAMAAAEVGVDVYGEDPSVAALEGMAAEMFGKQAALFLSSGTQSNLAALLSHCQRGDEYIIGDSYHVFRAEAGGAAVLGGVSPFPLPTDEAGGISVAQVEAVIKPDDPHYPASRLVCLENTVSGRVQHPDHIAAIADMAHSRGLAVHLDGARIMNAAVALDVEPAALAAPVDSLSVCLSKGLGAPVGSVLCGSHDFVARARRMRKMLGGGMRQAGVLAVCGSYALSHNVARLAEDHANAAKLADGLAAVSGLRVDRSAVETNMVFIAPDPADHAPLRAHLADHGIILGGGGQKIRLVTHLDVDSGDMDRVIETMSSYFS